MSVRIHVAGLCLWTLVVGGGFFLAGGLAAARAGMADGRGTVFMFRGGGGGVPPEEPVDDGVDPVITIDGPQAAAVWRIVP